MTASPNETVTELDLWRSWIAKLESSCPKRRLAAAHHLRDAGAAVVPLLLESLADAETTTARRQAIITTLRLMGPAARSALPALQALVEDEQLGEQARDAIRHIGRRFRIDPERLLDVGFAVCMIVLIVLTVLAEAGSWVELWEKVDGPALPIAIAWGVLGAVGGAFLGSNLGGSNLAKKGAKLLGTSGACLGAVLGRHVGEMLEPLLQALTF